MTETEHKAVEVAGVSFAEFLVGTPLLTPRVVELIVQFDSAHSSTVSVFTPAIQLHCPSAHTCGGTRFFDAQDLSIYNFKKNAAYDHFVYYKCRNCQKTMKSFALRFSFGDSSKRATITKLGEQPAYGEPRPNAIKDVLDDEIEYFDRAYRSENAGLGIGAFAYYRRFVESHKDKIIAAIRKVALSQGAKPEVFESLDRASKTNSFENAVAIVKDGIPDSLRYQGGHNPLTLLHTALSVGLHSDDDVECLELAKDIRLVLTDLAERTTAALKNDDDLGKAVKRLLEKGARRSPKPSEQP